MGRKSRGFSQPLTLVYVQTSYFLAFLAIKVQIKCKPGFQHSTLFFPTATPQHTPAFHSSLILSVHSFLLSPQNQLLHLLALPGLCMY